MNRTLLTYALVLLLHVLAPSAQNAAKAQPIDIKGQKQLFIDDYIIESMEPGVYQLLNQPVKYHDNPVIGLGSPWERAGALSHGGDAGNVFYDEEKGLFRFYGWMIDWALSGKWLFYAQSKDGIHWEKPPLGQVKYRGYDTNFIALSFTEDPGNLGVFKDPAAKTPDEKYKMIYRRGQGMYPAHSPDGIHWTAYDVDEPALPYASDTNNNILWDAKYQRYMLYARSFTHLGMWLNPERVYPKDARTRTPVWASSSDFLHWDGPKDIREPDRRYVAFHTDTKDRIGDRDFYTLEVLPYEGGYVGFTSVYHNMFGLEPAGLDSGNARSPWVDRMDVQLVWSRDGKSFARVGDRRVFLPTGPEGSWDADLIYTVQAPIVREDLGEIWIYYEGFVGRHWFNQRGDSQMGQVGLAKLRLDGFVSVTGKGAFVTRPLIFKGNRLTINVTGVDKFDGESYGTVCVEVIDAALNQAVPEFGRDDCDPFGGDDVDHNVTWQGKADVSRLQGKAIKLKFHIAKAKLFAFQFIQTK